MMTKRSEPCSFSWPLFGRDGRWTDGILDSAPRQTPGFIPQPSTRASTSNILSIAPEATMRNMQFALRLTW